MTDLDGVIPAHGPYAVERQIGCDDTAITYLVLDRHLERPVALKVSHATPAATTSLLREAATLARLDHPSIAPVYDVGRCDDGRSYMFTAIEDGVAVTPGDGRGRGADRASSALALLNPVAQALAHAHEHGAVHGALGWDRVLVNERDHVMLVGWGVHARADAEAGDDVARLAAMLLGVGGGLPLALRRLARAATKPNSVITLTQIEVAILAWLDAERDVARRRQRAASMVAVGQSKIEEYRAASAEIEALEADCVVLDRELPPWRGEERRHRLGGARRRLRTLRMQRDDTGLQALTSLTAALGYDREQPRARELLADYHLTRLTEAEEIGDRHGQSLHAEMVLQYGGTTYAARIHGHGWLRLDSEPVGAEVWLSRIIQDGYVWQSAEPRLLGRTPLARVELTTGSYVAVLRRPGYVDVTYPVLISRLGEWSGRVRLLTTDEVGHGFLHVPAGPFRSGLDDNSAAETRLDDFCIARYPVTFADYLEFLNVLALEDRDQALRHRPRVEPSGYFAALDGDGRFIAREPDNGDAMPPDWPVFGITADDALAYCAWRSNRDQRAYRLPSANEWHKAARGVDGRRYPWGDRFDPSLCNMASSLPRRDIAVVDSFPADRSVYGVRGLAGNISDWLADRAAVRAGEADWVTWAGGSWCSLDADWCRCQSTRDARADTFRVFIGFRLAHTPD